jgi:hypothetical protein
VHYFRLYAMGAIPVGSYNASGLANIGLGHAAVDGGASYTYFDPVGGHEISATVGFTDNLMNHTTQYRNGTDFHLGWSASQFLSKQLMVGLTGYWYHQLTADSGPGAILGSFESSVGSVGPQIGYVFDVADRSIFANLRGYKEFAAEHRLEGFAIILTVSIPLSPTKR